MKKFVGGFIFVLIILLALVYYQRQKVSHSLQNLLAGKTFSNYGIKIQIPPGEASVRGWLRPYVNIPRLVVDLSTWGLMTPLQLENAVAFQDLWGNGGMVLEVPRDITSLQNVTLSHPYFEITLDGTIQVIGAKSVQIQETKNGDITRWMGPELTMGKLEGPIPDRLVFRIQGMEKIGGSGDGKPKIKMGGFELGVESTVQENLRNWTLFFMGVGGSAPLKQGTVEIGGWKLLIRGSTSEMPFENILPQLQEVRETFPDFSTVAPKTKEPAELLSMFSAIQNLLLKSDFKILSKELGWDGLKGVGSDGQDIILVKPLLAQGKVLERDGNLTATGNGKLEEIKISLKNKTPVNLKDIQIKQTMFYQNTTFPKLMGYFLNYFQNILNQLGQKDMDKRFQSKLFSSLAVYPNQVDMELRMGQLSYQTEAIRATHSDLKLGFFIKSNEAGYWAQDEFDLIHADEPRKNVEKGKGKFSITSKFPWNGMINISRQAIQDSNFNLDFFDIFEKQKTGLALELFLDLGANYFSVDLTSDLFLPLGQALRNSKFPKNWQDIKKVERWRDDLWHESLQTFVNEGSFLFNLKIERLSKLQAFMESQKSGSSLGLAVLAPYTEINSVEDSLKIKLEYKNQKILVNDQPSASLVKLLVPFFTKFGIHPPAGIIDESAPPNSPQPVQKLPAPVQ